jgi:hypothetical protein
MRKLEIEVDCNKLSCGPCSALTESEEEGTICDIFHRFIEEKAGLKMRCKDCLACDRGIVKEPLRNAINIMTG